MARYTPIVMTLVILATLFLSVQAGGAMVTYDQVQDSLNLGIDWLEPQQNLDNSPPESYGSWGEPGPVDTLDCNYHHRVEKTSLALLKMNDRARELGTDPAPEVQDGLDFIFRKVQEDGSIWDYFSLEKCGFENAPDTVTETSLAIMAIVNTGNPDAKVLDPLSPVFDMTYYQVVENAVAHLAWTQRTREDARKSGFGDEGGWTGGKDPAWLDVPYFGEKPADQVHTGIASLALVHAKESFGVPVPPDTLTQLKTWVGNIQDYPGSGGAYYFAPPPSGNPNIHYTGDLLIEQHLLGRTPAAKDVQASLRYISNNWNAREGAYKDYFLLTSGLSLAGVETLPVAGSDVDWFDAILAEVIREQVAYDPDIGSWLDFSGDPILSTEWALLTIEGHVYPGGMTVTKMATPTEVSAGDPVTYSYGVQNTGRSAIYDLSLEDDRLGIIDTPALGDDGDGILEPGETWTYTKDATLSVTTRNIGTASGVDLLDRNVVAQSDPVTVYVNGATGLSVLIDIKPGSCPNAFNLGEVGVLPVAVVGTADFDVIQMDPGTITLNGVPALKNRWHYEDVATPYIDPDAVSDPVPEDCTTQEADGFMDLSLKFDHQELAASFSPVPLKNDLVPLTLTGSLKPEFGGTPFAGTDYIWVVQ